MSTSNNTSNSFLNKIINNILLFIIAFLPLSNPIGQVLTNGFNLNSNVLLWKEFLIFIVIILMLIQIILLKKLINIKFIILFFSILLLIGFSTLSNKIGLQTILIGFRFELFWIMFLCVGSDWLNNFGAIEIKKLIFGLYFGIISILLLTLSSLIFGAQNFYTFLQYKENLDGLNKVSSLYCHSIDASGLGCRLSGGFNNPNHFAAYLVLVIPIVIYFLFNNKSYIIIKITNILLFTILILFSWLNYSRFAWLTLGILFLIMIFNLIKVNNIKLKLFTNYLIGITIFISFLISFVIFLLPFNSKINNQLPYYLSKPGSTETHHKLTNIAKDIIIKNLPNSIYSGYGIGQAGPAAKSDYTKVEELRIVKDNINISDKYSIPANQIPISENWYLQLILNGGIIYFLLYFYILSRPLKNIFLDNQFNFYLALSIFGLIFGNLFLHLWESSVVSIYFVIISLTILQNEKNLEYI